MDLNTIRDRLEKLPGMLSYELEKKKDLMIERYDLEHNIKEVEAETIWMFYKDYPAHVLKSVVRRSSKKLNEELLENKKSLEVVTTAIEVYSKELTATQSLVKLINLEPK